MEENTKPLELTDADVVILQNEEDGMLAYRERRHDDWTDNYTLGRDKVITNRLTQRQTVNIPLMKYVMNTVLKEMADAPQLYFDNLGNNQQREIYYNEYWKETARQNKLVVKDHVDKKQNGYFGRSFKKLNIEDGKFKVTLVDPQCMLVHRFTDPTDIDTSPCLTETDIYVTLNDILDNEDYFKEGKDALKKYFTEEAGNLESDDNYQKASDKADRLKNMGDTEVEDPTLGETYVELHQTFRMEKSDIYKKKVLFRYVLAVTKGGTFKLHKIEFCDLFPKKTKDDFWQNHFPYTSWASDPEATDFWSDGVADIIRPINKVLNVWISQLVENRTLQNFGMKYYDSTNKKFVPQTFSPQPFAHFPVPGDPSKIIKDVITGNLTGSWEEITALIAIAEKASATGGANNGAVETRKVTLGEVEYALANAKERIQMQQTFYREDWKDLGLKFTKFLEAGAEMLDPMTVYKKGRLGKKMYKKEIAVKDWFDEEGYLCEVKEITNKQEEDIAELQKMEMLKNEMPDNVPLIEIRRRKMMEFSGLSPDDIARVEEFEKQRSLMPVNPVLPAPGNEAPANAMASAGGQGLPEVPDIGQV